MILRIARISPRDPKIGVLSDAARDSTLPYCTVGQILPPHSLLVFHAGLPGLSAAIPFSLRWFYQELSCRNGLRSASARMDRGRVTPERGEFAARVGVPDLQRFYLRRRKRRTARPRSAKPKNSRGEDRFHKAVTGRLADWRIGGITRNDVGRKPECTVNERQRLAQHRLRADIVELQIVQTDGARITRMRSERSADQIFRGFRRAPNSSTFQRVCRTGSSAAISSRSNFRQNGAFCRECGRTPVQQSRTDASKENRSAHKRKQQSCYHYS